MQVLLSYCHLPCGRKTITMHVFMNKVHYNSNKMEEAQGFYFSHPCTCSISGPSGSGKTYLTVRILNNLDRIFHPTPRNVVFYYTQWQSAYNNIQPKPRFIKGLPSQEGIENIKEPSLFVIDDAMSKLDQAITDIFIMYSHHRDLSVILLLQNYYNKNKHLRDINTNTNYVIFMKNPRNKLAVSHIAKESFPNQYHYVMESYLDATKVPHGYLLFNFNQQADDHLRLLTNIIPEENDYQIAYVPR